MRDRLLEEARKAFKPEFINRLDDIIVFHQLTKDDLLQIVELEVAKVFARIREKEVSIELDQSAKELLIEKGYDPQYGARPMRRAVERYLEDPFAEELLRGNIKAGDVVRTSAADGKLQFHVSEPQSSQPAGAS
jgi:ATP-dependent Clp protease ATP-binding subunit ClpC